MFANHIKLTKNGGFGGKLAGGAISLPGVQGLLKKGLEKDYKENLY